MLKGKTVFWVGLVAIVGALAFALTFGSLEQGVDESKAYQVYGVFDDATGLVKNSRITLSGIPVGQIKEIELDPEQTDKARVTMVIEKRVTLFEGIYDPKTGAWRNGAAAMRKQASLLGDYYISLTPGVAGKKLGNGDQIRNVITESGLDSVLNQLEKSSEQIFPNLEKISDDIAAVTGSLRGAIADEEGARKLKQIRDDVALTTANVAQLSADLKGFMRDDIFSQGKTIRSILKNVEATTASVRNTGDRAGKKLDTILGNVERLTADLKTFVGDQTAKPEDAKPGTVAKTLATLDKNMTLLEGTLENVKSVTAKIDKGEGTVGRLLTDTKLIDDFERVVSDIGTLTGPLGALRVDVDIRSEYLFGQGAMKHYISMRLRPKPDKYYLFQLVDDPRGDVTTIQRTTTSNDPTKPPVLTETIKESRSGFKFTAQFAKRWHFLTFRYGIMESTGGFGVDVDLLNDALRFKFDVFNFDFSSLPRVRLLAAWNFIEHVYVAAGLDDILDGDKRDYFIGLGVNFTDSDIKSLLPFLPF